MSDDEAQLEIEAGPAISGALLRFTVAAVAMPALLSVSSTTYHLLGALLLGVVSAARPGAWAAGLVLVACVTLLALEVSAYSWQVPLVILCVHATWALSVIAAQVGWRTRVEVEVLRPLLVPFVVVQLTVQALAAVAVMLDAATSLPWVGIVAVAAIGMLSWFLHIQLRARLPRQRLSRTRLYDSRR